MPNPNDNLAIGGEANMRSTLKRSRGPESPTCTKSSNIQSSKRNRAIDTPDAEPGIAAEEFTVGWVCALPLEMAAAKGMLDQSYSDLQQQDPADHNSYMLGRIGGHHIVIACLPTGVYGTTPAATVAKDLLRTFKSVRFGLMVGIGGGAPSSLNDIRLGDVVVSKPSGTHGGLIQYDRGKTVQEGEFQRTGSLNMPPQLLLTALSRLQAEHLSKESLIPQFLSELVAKSPKRMKKKFSYQGSSNDCLFKPEYDHPDRDSGDAVDPGCSQCDTAQKVRREARDDTDPVIHYGNIASGNKVIKHGKTRDQLSKALGTLCFEMEAAGLQDFPCLVIRGICDYADSHKNKMWQEYAAATAAAFTKELLSFIPPERVRQEQPVPQLVSVAKEQLQVTTQHLNVSSEHLVEHKRTNELLEDRPIELRVVHEAYYDSANVRDSPRCEMGTRTQVMKRITQWAENDSSEITFWLVGPAGTGKSTIARSVVDSLASQNRLVAGYFFKRGEQGRNDTTRLFSTLAMQLIEAIPLFKCYLQKSLDSLDKDAIEQRSLEFQFDKLLWNPLGALPPVSTSQGSKVIIIDALDECERPEHYSRVLGLLSRLCDITTVNLRILITSRSSPKIIDAIEPLVISKVVLSLELHREFPEDTKDDIRTFLEARFADIKKKRTVQQTPWPVADDLDRLVKLATNPEPLFIYAATLCRFIYDEQRPRNPKTQLKLWLKQCEENKSQLDQIYDTVLSQAFSSASENMLVFIGTITCNVADAPWSTMSAPFFTSTFYIGWKLFPS
ncbi:g-protein beta wd-40 repeats containing [Colletotrichum karsti]|uniref:G-protein beta wd-40 repeats containing n=1 Tax=Colletotrichum karsti TaxID=1095194 RepID=A0A9P6I1A9_9PEZI|nr:g-protein beta wd-40 repeats containing [Colletotrichum karsti]KAF9873982.1 g-protein beta wd-40 repeats containing [Colletotrichum karsti]